VGAGPGLEELDDAVQELAVPSAMLATWWNRSAMSGDQRPLGIR